MRMKRFEAPSMTEALRRIREEFGPDAVILSARSLRRFPGAFGLSRTTRVEVTAAVDAAGWAAPEPAASAASPAAGSASTRRGLLSAFRAHLRGLGDRGRSPVSADGPPGLGEALHRGFVAGGVDPEIATRWVDRLLASPEADDRVPSDRLRAAAVQLLAELGFAQAEVPAAGQRRSAFIGQAGAGKTTLVAKLAAAEVLRNGRRLALLSLDDRRICGARELSAVASALGVPFAAARTEREVAHALRGWSAVDWVLIDTAGVAPDEEDRIRETLGLLSAAGCAETHLVLPAGLRDADCRRVVDRFAPLGIRALAFTRLDETAFPGAVLNAALAFGLPVSWIGTGRRIPEDLVEQPAAWLVERLWPGEASLRAGLPPRPAPEAPASWVANRNSELYHREGCPWARRIKADHLLRFESAAAAETAGYQPCRTCISALEGAAGKAPADPEVTAARPRCSVRL